MSVIKVDNSNFEEEVINESSKPVLVDFWASWCGPCRALGPIVEEVAEEMADELKVTKLSIEDAPEIGGKYKVKGIPTLILFKNGKAVDQKVGLLTKENLVAFIKENS